jgi:hypothetical protein
MVTCSAPCSAGGIHPVSAPVDLDQIPASNPKGVASVASSFAHEKKWRVQQKSLAKKNSQT